MLTPEQKQELQKAVQEMDFEEVVYDGPSLDDLIGGITEDVISEAYGQSAIYPSGDPEDKDYRPAEVSDEDYTEADEFVEPIIVKRFVEYLQKKYL